MELVAASKMRKAQEYAQKSRAYREAAHSLLARLSTITEVSEHPLFAKRPVKTRLYVMITSNSGLAGAYNANIIKQLVRSITEDKKNGIKSQIIAIGKRGAQFTRNLRDIDLLAAYSAFSDHPSANELRPVLNSIAELYETKAVDDVQLLYTQFKSNILQVATQLSVLPAIFDPSAITDAEKTQPITSVTFEPSVSEVLDNAALRLVEVQIWQALLESIASEHSMRMLAMKNATDNASELIDDLTLAFNTARQAAITQELAEITGGAEAIK
jgi:F-type H+-transporting ATPase subunit gamma